MIFYTVFGFMDTFVYLHDDILVSYLLETDMYP